MQLNDLIIVVDIISPSGVILREHCSVDQNLNHRGKFTDIMCCRHICTSHPALALIDGDLHSADV